jgi:hypothetical protein
VNYESILKQPAIYHKNRGHPFLLICVALLSIAGIGIISYDSDFSDNNDPPVVALQYPVIIYNNFQELEHLKISGEPIELPLINIFSLLNRAPPL